jgi:hypothetical protein
MLMQITIDIDLPPEIKADLPKSGKDKADALNKHAITIKRVAFEHLTSIKDDLEFLGYMVDWVGPNSLSYGAKYPQEFERGKPIIKLVPSAE